jgi:hypothetical protein
MLKKLPSMRSSTHDNAISEAVSSSSSSLPVATAVVVGEVDVTGATVAVPATTVSDSLDEDATARDEKASSSELTKNVPEVKPEASKQDNVPQQLDLVFSVDCTGRVCSLLKHLCVYRAKRAFGPS